MSMDLSGYIGKSYQETEFYQLLLFEVEENFDYFHNKNIHFYFDRISGNQIKVTDLVYFKNSYEMNQTARSIIEKKEWIEIHENENHTDLVLVRFDRTGTLSIVWRNKTHTEDWSYGWADEGPPRPRLSEEQIRFAVLELCGFLEDQLEQQKLKSKKSV
jgi:hypothetical protein